MPLSATLATEAIFAFNYTPENWQSLRDRASELRFPCCDAGVVLKRSPLGTQFFAHARRGKCTTAPETAEHLQVKDVIARTAIAAGWEARSEVRGKTPDGDDWVADVLVVRGTVKLAFEVQWSRQSTEEATARQARYAKSGVRALWLMRQDDIPTPSKVLPAFKLALANEGFEVAIDWDSVFKLSRQCIPLAEFIAGTLSRKLIWRPLEGRVVDVKIGAFMRKCWHCNTWVPVPNECRINDEFSFQVLPACSRSQELIDAILPSTESEARAVGEIWIENGQTTGHCYACGAPIALHEPRPRGPHDNRKIKWLPTRRVTVTGAMLDAIGLPRYTDNWGFLA